MDVAAALTIVIAVRGAETNLREIESRLDRARFPQVQFCFVFAGPPPAGSAALRDCEVVGTAPGTLVPELWREGVLRARAPKVAFTTAQCIPAQHWVAALLATDLSAHVGVGGTVDLDTSCRAAQRAVYLLRYSNFAPPRLEGEVSDIAADNAVYRTANIIENADLLSAGFWEPSFHRRFAAQGLLLKLYPPLQVTYRGHEPVGEFMRLRFTHGRQFGAARGATASRLRQLGWIATSPFIPIVILARIVRRAISRPGLMDNLGSAAPSLILFTLAWSIGEACGYVCALSGKRYLWAHQ